jgi:hypothetical protein
MRSMMYSYSLSVRDLEGCFLSVGNVERWFHPELDFYGVVKRLATGCPDQLGRSFILCLNAWKAPDLERGMQISERCTKLSRSSDDRSQTDCSIVSNGFCAACLPVRIFHTRSCAVSSSVYDSTQASLIRFKVISLGFNLQI